MPKIGKVTKSSRAVHIIEGITEHFDDGEVYVLGGQRYTRQDLVDVFQAHIDAIKAVDAASAAASAAVAREGGLEASCSGPAPAPLSCAHDTDCTPTGLCISNCECPPTCCGAARACCSTNGDSCCSGACDQGACTSDGLLCASDADCTEGTVCIPDLSSTGSARHVCFRLTGAACQSDHQCGPFRSCGGGRCTCSTARTGASCATNQDCCEGECRANLCQLMLPGGVCKSDADCEQGWCSGGVCTCLPLGAAIPDGGGSGLCCSLLSSPSGRCATSAASPCSSAADCYGGPCTPQFPSQDSVCACAGPGGSCSSLYTSLQQNCCSGKCDDGGTCL